ncbi:transcription elongation factor B polypeptide 3-like [Octopus vulgaris]|uniref:Transcription elongation factor B polypeptide 3-like n=2 Tax=Octopus TaxID=6643 RepID=A0AA36FBI6_OCTVU|nr:transcription elongation factor B polypeptide 3 [Octopus sinensis]CAI9728828.1 transcription elongation factor B polypeptide 3-like [Octopus vulgaris]
MADINAQQKLMKCRAYLEGNPTDVKLLYIFNKLLRFPVTIDILQSTGIGKAVNSFRKREGEIGEKARAVVTLWKSLVSKQENNLTDKRSVSSSSSPYNSTSTEQSGKTSSDDEKTTPCRTKRQSSPQSSPQPRSSTKECDKTSENIKERKKHQSSKSNSETSRSPEKKNKTVSDSSKEHHQSSKSKSESESKAKVKKSQNLKRKKKSAGDGLSFEDFMNYDDSAMKKKFKKKKHDKDDSSKSSKEKKELNSPKDSSKSHSSSSSLQLSKKSKEPKSSTSHVLHVPSASKELLPSESEILSSLPETQAHYHPWRLSDGNKVERKAVTNSGDDLDSVLIGIKSRTRECVYSGKKATLKELPTLFTACIQVLIENIDSLEYVGGIPFLILQPVLERCTVSQLYTLEDYNPHFLEDSDKLWKIHCQRDFRGYEPDEMESWREMYLRKFDEREAKLKVVKASISASMSKVTPERTVKMAFVEAPAKPPRDVRRKQLKHGTGTITKDALGPYRTYKPVVNNKLLASTAASHSSSSGPSSARIQVSQQHRSTKVIAPMMQKTMKMIKKMQRR